MSAETRFPRGAAPRIRPRLGAALEGVVKVGRFVTRRVAGGLGSGYVIGSASPTTAAACSGLQA